MSTTRHRHRSAILPVFLSLSAWPSVIAAGQTLLRPSAVPVCAPCDIRIRPVLTLGDKDGPGSFHGEPYSMAMDGRGRYLVAVPNGREERIYVFDAGGKLIARFGPYGEGPGQLQSVRVIAVTTGDTLHVYDDVSGRHSVFGPDYRFVRSHSSPRDLSSVVFLPNGIGVVAANVNDPGRIGLLYHRFHPNGNYLGSFGDSSQVVASGRPSLAVRRMGRSHSGGFWSASWLYRLRLELWSASGSLLRVVQPEAGWFTPYTQILGPTPDRPPQAMLYGLWEDRQGRVWISGVTPGKDYRRGLGPRRMIEGAPVYPVQDAERVWDGVIEVFDPNQGVLLASTPVDAPYHFVLSDSLVAGVRTDRDDLLRIDVATVNLHQR